MDAAERVAFAATRISETPFRVDPDTGDVLASHDALVREFGTESQPPRPFAYAAIEEARGTLLDEPENDDGE